MDEKYNVYKINEIFLEPDAHYDRSIPSNFKHDSYFYCVLSSCYKLLRNIFSTIIIAPLKYKLSGVSSYKSLYEGKILFRLPSLNNIRSVNRVIEEVCCKRPNVHVLEGVLDNKYYPLVLMDLVSIWYLPQLWHGFKKLSPIEKKIVCYNLVNFCFTPGVVWFYRKMLKKHRPECVVLANDHIFLTKPLALLCEDYGVPCVYIQHASVSYAFPELHFSCSFLDGMDSLKKYAYEGKSCKGKILLLGAARFDELSKVRTKRDYRKRECIGLSINKIDDNAMCDDLCNDLLRRYPQKTIKIRMHPAMKNHPFMFSEKTRIISTCATDESIFDYLDSIDLQISNDSSVHLDAILGGVKTVAYNLSNYSYGDNYGYVKKGMVQLAKTKEQLFHFIDNVNNITIKEEIVRQYDESFKKKYEGKCSEIIAEYIISGCQFDMIENKYDMEKKGYNHHTYYVIPN